MPRQVFTKKRNTLLGIPEVQAKIKEILEQTSGNEAGANARNRVRELVGEAAKTIKEKAVSNATSQGWPKQVVNSIFTFNDPAKDKPKRTAALVGINKQKSMLQWTAAANPKSPKAKVSPGGKIAMSLATMYEFGTSRMKAKPAFRKAYYQAVNTIGQTLKQGFVQILEDLSKK